MSYIYKAVILILVIKKQMLCKNQGRTENDGGSVQSDFNICLDGDTY